MRKKYIIKKSIQSLLMFIILFYVIQKFRELIIQLPPSDQQMADIINFIFNLNEFTIGIMVLVIVMLFILFSLSKKRLTYDEKLDVKFEYLYSTFDESQKKELNALNKEDRRSFVEEYLKLKPIEFSYEINKVCDDKLNPSLPKFVIWTKKIVLICSCLLLVYNFNGMQSFFISYYNTRNIALEQSRLITQMLEQNYNVKPDEDVSISTAKQVLIEDQTLNIEGIPPIVIRCDGKASEYYINAIVSEIKRQPLILLNNCSAFYIKNENNYDGFPGSVGMAYSVDNHIDILYDHGVLDSNLARIIVHELSHLFDYNNGFISNTPQLIDYYNKYKNTLMFEPVYAEYAATDPTEFFAEYTAGYYLGASAFMTLAPDLYAYYQSYFH